MSGSYGNMYGGDVTLCSVADTSRRFGGAYFLYDEGGSNLAAFVLTEAVNFSKCLFNIYKIAFCNILEGSSSFFYCLCDTACSEILSYWMNAVC